MLRLPGMHAEQPVTDPHRVTAVNLVTATHLSRVPLQRIGFWMARSPDWFARIFDEEGLSVQFKTFNFLHTARFALLGRFPRVTRRQPRESRWGPRWIVYIGNYDGAWRPYFGTFMEAMSEGVYDIWGQSIGYPGFPAPNTANELQDWLDTRLSPSQHYYAAYPWASANDVRSAVRVRREVLSAALELKEAYAAGQVTNVTDIGPTVDDLARRLRQCLGPIEPPPGWRPRRDGLEILPNGGVCGYAAVFPVRPGEEDALRRAIEALHPGDASPFHRVQGTHFARLALLARKDIGRYQGKRKPVPPRNSYLLFAADFDATTVERSSGEQFVRAVYKAMPETVRSIWSHCYGFANVNDFGATFEKVAKQCRRRFLVEFIDCPDQSLDSVLDALDFHRRFVDLVRRRNEGSRINACHLLAFLPCGRTVGVSAK